MLIGQGVQEKEIRKRFGVTTYYLRKLKWDWGVIIRPIIINNRQYTLDENFFEKIDTEEKAYILGFIYADGCRQSSSYNIVITLKACDKEILEKIQKSLKSNKPIYNCKGRYSSQHAYTEKVKIEISSKKLYEDISKLGLESNKSLSLKFPLEDKLPKHLERHFIRGYFDGDGSIFMATQGSSYRVNIISTSEFCDSIIEKTNLPFKKSKEKRVLGDCSYIVLSKKTYLEQFYHYLYDDSTIFLERKHNKFLKFLKTIRGSTTIIRKPEMVIV